MKIDKISYGGWANCLRIANGTTELVVTLDVGPRIIRFGFEGGENVFAEYAAQMGKTGGDDWRIYGGHRLWHAPEAQPRTYTPDNQPVECHVHGTTVHIVQAVEAGTGIQKELEIRMEPKAARVDVLHRLTNTLPWDVELAVWALSVMAPGTLSILPLPPRGEHDQNLAPSSAVILWAYTNMSDPRWTWGEKYILLQQQGNSKPQKIGLLAPDGWIAAFRAGNLFVKQVDFEGDLLYPDLGCNLETYTDADMLEIETLSPLTLLGAGASAEHLETWSLHRDVPQPKTDADVEREILPRIME
jgi:hypothetical protein